MPAQRLDCRVDGREMVPCKARFGEQVLVGLTKVPHPNEHFVLLSLDGLHNVSAPMQGGIAWRGVWSIGGRGEVVRCGVRNCDLCSHGAIGKRGERAGPRIAMRGD